MILSRISILLLTSCPSAVVGDVSLAVVKSVDGHANWFFSHVCEKISKIQPSKAHSDSATAVIGEISTRRVLTSLQHGTPCVISWRSLSSLKMTMSFPRGETLVTKATARLRTSIAQALRYYRMQRTATTAAQPARLTACGVLCSGQNGKSPKHLPSKINKVVRHCYHSCNERITFWKARGNRGDYGFRVSPSPTPNIIVA
jgi:hypothetical protein